MSTFIVCRRETKRVDAADIIAARRSLSRLGTAPFDDEQVEQTLYFARALPAALDVIADPRARATGRRLWPTACQPPHKTPPHLLATALHEVGSGLILVRFGPRDEVQSAPRELAQNAAGCRFLLEDDPAETDVVVLKRFTVGKTH